MRISDWSSDVCSSDLMLIDRPGIVCHQLRSVIPIIGFTLGHPVGLVNPSEAVRRHTWMVFIISPAKERTAVKVQVVTNEPFHVQARKGSPGKRGSAFKTV